MIVLVVVTVLILVLAVFFMNGKTSFLIAGYNTMPDNEKAKYDVAALSRFMGKTMFAVAGGLVLLILGLVLESSLLSIAAIILILLISLFAVKHANTGDRFKKKADSMP